MPTLDAHQSNEFTKLLIMGDSGSGKTGALASLVAEGYKLRILDFDNGLDVLKEYVRKDSPEMLQNVEFRTLRDKRKATQLGSLIDGVPKAYINALKMLDQWKYKDDEGVETDLGVPADWGKDTILVVDSLTRLSDACFDWQEPLTPRGKSGDYDRRATFYNAQGAIRDFLATLTSEGMRTNVIVIAHVRYIERDDGTKKGFPTSVGAALSPDIPTYFNTVALFETSGGTRTLKTVPTSMIDLKNPKPFEMAKSYPIETGLADFFRVLRDPPEKKVTKLTLKKRA